MSPVREVSTLHNRLHIQSPIEVFIVEALTVYQSGRSSH